MIDFVVADGDIALDQHKGIKTTDKVVESVIRRAATIPTGFSKVVREGGSQRIINTSYGTDLAAYLSTSITGITLVDELVKAATDDGRIELYDIQYSAGYNTINVNLTYMEYSNDQVEQISVGF